ncbi:MAG: sugar transferase [Clostridia bacterium]|nr:sugar transferase [Clostridia bacterium]
MYQRYIKRLLDIVISLTALVILSPVMLLVAVLIKLDSPGPVIFAQKRYGKNKTFFHIYKFRSMRADTPRDVPTSDLHGANGFITPLGNVLRKTSLDELPQLWNILRGDMSLIGPRPALWNQYDLMELRDQNGSSLLRPGLSGWAQVNGRDSLELEMKARRDGEYAQKISFAFDVKCLLLTIVRVIRRDDIVEGDAVKKTEGKA